MPSRNRNKLKQGQGKSYVERTWPVIIEKKEKGYISRFPNVILVSKPHKEVEKLIDATKPAILKQLKLRRYNLFPSKDDFPKQFPKDSNSMIVWISLNVTAGKTVRKNLTLPRFLAELAHKKGINLSQFLANALMEKLI